MTAETFEFRCKNCGGSLRAMLLTSNPPQTEWRCDHCSRRVREKPGKITVILK